MVANHFNAANGRRGPGKMATKSGAAPHQTPGEVAVGALLKDGQCSEPEDAEQRLEEEDPEKRHRWINRQITSAARANDLTWLMQVVRAHASKMNLINASTALHRVAKLALASSSPVREAIIAGEAFRRLQQVIRQHVMVSGSNARNGISASAIDGDSADSEMRCLSIICWSSATLRTFDHDMFEEVAKVSSARLGELKPFELSNMLWAFAKVSYKCTDLLDGVVDLLINRRGGEFNPQCLATIVWALGTTKVNHPVIFSSFGAEIMHSANKMAPQAISNTVWAYARVQRQDAPLFRAMAAAACREQVIWTFKPQELSNMCWAFATAGLPHSRLFERIAEVAVSWRNDLPTQNVANIVWAYVKLAMQSRSTILPPLMEVAVERIHLYKSQEVSAILWAAAREANCPSCRNIFYAAAREFRSRLSEFSSQALACMVEAFALAKIEGCDDFFEAALRSGAPRLDTFLPPSLCALFRGVVLHALQNPDSEAQNTKRLRMACEHMQTRSSELLWHHLAHLRFSVDMLQRSGKKYDCLELLDPLLANVPPSTLGSTSGAAAGSGRSGREEGRADPAEDVGLGNVVVGEFEDVNDASDCMDLAPAMQSNGGGGGGGERRRGQAGRRGGAARRGMATAAATAEAPSGGGYAAAPMAAMPVGPTMPMPTGPPGLNSAGSPWTQRKGGKVASEESSPAFSRQGSAPTPNSFKWLNSGVLPGVISIDDDKDGRSRASTSTCTSGEEKDSKDWDKDSYINIDMEPIKVQTSWQPPPMVRFAQLSAWHQQQQQQMKFDADWASKLERSAMFDWKHC